MNRALLRLLDVLLVLAAAAQAREVFAVIAARYDAPMDLEWMEGGILVSAWRVTQGLPLYGEPTVEYIPFIYPPLHAWVLGALAQVWPLGWTLGRVLSACCTALAASAVAFGAWREGARPSLAVACAGMFLGCYSEGGTFYDLVRTDALLIALLGWSLALARGKTTGELVAGGVLLAAAFAAKHNAALLGLPIAFAVWRRDGWRRAALFGAASAGPALLFTLGMQVASGGHFLKWLLAVPSTHGMVSERLLPGWKDGSATGAQADLYHALPVATIAGLATAWAWPNRRYWIGVALTMLVAVSLMRGHVGGYVNVLIPGFWVLAMLPALTGVALSGERMPPRLRAWGPHLAALLALGQLWEGRDLRQPDLPAGLERVERALAEGRLLDKYVPSDAEEQGARAFVDELRAIDGDVFLPYGPWYAVLAQKPPTFSLICLWDVDHAGNPYRSAVKMVKRAIEEQHWAAAVLPDKGPGYGIEDHYVKARTLKARAFPTQTGWTVRLRHVWIPRK